MRAMIHSVVIAVLVIASLFACDKAMGDTYLILHIGSRHAADTYPAADGTMKKYNENNMGIGIAYDINNNIQVRAGGYDNSHDKLSLYGTLSLHTDIRKAFGIGVQSGPVSGYGPRFTDGEEVKLQVMALPFVRFAHKQYGVEIGYVPPKFTRTSFVTLSTSMRF